MQIPIQQKSQNLVRQESSAKITRPPGFYKSMVFDALIILSALLFGYAYRGYVDGTVGYLWAFAALSVFSVMNLLGVFFTKWFSRRFFVLVFEVAAIIVFFYDLPTNLLSLAAGVTIIFLFLGELNARQEIHNSLNIRFLKISIGHLSKFTTGMALLLVILYYPHLDAQQAYVPRPAFDAFYSWATGITNQFYSEVKLSESFRTLVESIQWIQGRSIEEFRKLRPAEQESTVANAADVLIDNVSKSVGVAIDADRAAKDVFYDIVSSFLNNWKEKFGSNFFIAWVVTVFFVIRGLGTIFYWLIGMVSLFFYQLLISFGFIHVFGESRSKETIDY
ncbi:MAG: hypothetical protein AAB652_02445 [Patescibacteria group bacterium]